MRMKLTSGSITLMKTLGWFCTYLIVLCAYTTIFTLLISVYALFPSSPLSSVLTIYSIGVRVGFLVVGIGTLLPLARYAYTRQAGTNPAIARESFEEIRQGKEESEKKALGLILGIVGITLFFPIDPWMYLFESLAPYNAAYYPLSILVDAISLILLVAIYERKLKQHVSY
jgi:hypothetical protein